MLQMNSMNSMNTRAMSEMYGVEKLGDSNRNIKKLD